ncbi:MAG: TRAP transporter small permease subunit, partial [Acetobacteraceae bacterium]|nr:TRAP transporter small permease subunit [Acetobacteraceae bacterium]
ARTALEALVLAIAFAMVAFFAYSTFDQMTDSFEFGEVSQGMLGVPLWIPQMALPIGAGLFALALLDDLVVVLAGGTPSYRVGQAGGALDRAVEEL